MIIEMTVPSPGESISEVEIATWLVAHGDYVERDQEICEIDSDKATLTIVAEESGAVSIKVEEGEAIDVGGILCTINTSVAGDLPIPKQVPSSELVSESLLVKTVSATENSYAAGIPSPSAKKMMAENGIDILLGSGKGGRVLKEDVVKAKASMGTGSGARGFENKKMSVLRRKVAERLVAVKNETAMLTTFNEVDMKPIMDLRKTHKETFKETHGVGLGFMSFFYKSCDSCA
jgi:2-oxoglutarate dehydrogenase E2 component (dihydrolipoamide succinyltransferase)